MHSVIVLSFVAPIVLNDLYRSHGRSIILLIITSYCVNRGLSNNQDKTLDVSNMIDRTDKYK
jgi:hypothetical protein